MVRDEFVVGSVEYQDMGLESFRFPQNGAINNGEFVM